MKTKKQSDTRSKLFRSLVCSSTAAVVGFASQAFGQDGVAHVDDAQPPGPMGFGDATGVASVPGAMVPSPDYGLFDYQPPTGDSALRMSGRPIWQDEIGPRLRLETRIGDFLGTDDEGVGAVNVMLPFLFENSPAVVFVDARGTVTYQGNGAGSLGGGLRYYDEYQNRIYGVAGWWDYDDGHTNEYQQIALSFESVGRWVDARLNTYFALGDETHVLAQAPTGNVTPVQGPAGFLVEIGQRVESAYSGVSFEVGGPMPLLGRYGVEGFAGVYHYWSEAAEDVTGYSLRTAIHATDDLRLGVQVTDDATFGTEVFGTVVFTLPDGRPQRSFRPRRVREKMLDRVERRYRVTTETFDRTVLVDTSGMTPPMAAPGDDGFLLSNIIFVDPEADTNGTGTFTDPFNTFVNFATPQTNSLIVVRSGDVQGQVRLPDNSLLLSEAYLNLNPVDLITNFGPIQLPVFDAAASVPVFSNPTGGTLVTLIGDNTEVAGFTFDGRTNGTLLNDIIQANGVQGVRVHDNTFRNYRNAIDLRNVTGTVADSNAALIFSNNFFGSTGGSYRAVNVENNGIGTLDLELGQTEFAVNLTRGTALPARGNFTYGNTGEDANGNNELDGGEDANGNLELDRGVGFAVTANNRSLINARIVGNTAFVEPDTDGNGVLTTEDANRDGLLDSGEDLNANSNLDFGEDVNFNGVLDPLEDTNNDGVLNGGEDLNQNGVADIGSGTAFLVSAGSNGRVNLSFVDNLAEGNIGEGLHLIANQGTINANTLGEDQNANGRLDGFEDVNRDGILTITEDTNANGLLDPSEDFNGNGILDPFEDLNGNGVLDPSEDRNGNGLLDLGEDLDGDFITDRGEDANEDANGNGLFDAGEDLNGDGLFNLGDEDGFLDGGFVISGNQIFNNGGDGIRIDGLDNGLVDFRMTRNLIGDATDRSRGNGGIGLNVNSDSGSVIARVGFVYHEDLNFNGILDVGEDSNGNGRLDTPNLADGNQFVANVEGGVNFDLSGSSQGDIQVINNAIIGIGGGDFGFQITGDTTGQQFDFLNNSVLGIQIDRVTWDIAAAGLEFNTDVLTGGTAFAPLVNTEVITGLQQVNGQGQPFNVPNLSTSLDAVFNDFDPVNGLLDSEDVNGNGILDPGEDVNGNGLIDTEDVITVNGLLDFGEDVNGNGILDPGEDVNANNVLDPSEDLPEMLSFNTDIDPSGMPGTAVLSTQLIGSIFDVSFNTGQRLSGTVQQDPNDLLGVLYVTDSNNIGSGNGLSINVADGSQLQPSTIFNNVISDFGGTGLSVRATQAGNIENVVVRSNLITGNGNVGAAFQTSNTASANPLLGARLTAEFRNNVLTDNSGGAILGTANSGTLTFTDILGNTLRSNGSGISLASSQSGTLTTRITRNSILDSLMNNSSTGTGVEISADNATVILNELADNVISSNAGDGLVLTADNTGMLLVTPNEDVNGNGILDDGEDVNEDLPFLDGIFTTGEDINLDGILNLGNENDSLDRGIFNNSLSNNLGNSFVVNATDGSTVSLANVTQTTLLFNTAGTGGFSITGADSFVSGDFTSSTVSGDMANNPTSGPGFLAQFSSLTFDGSLFEISVGGPGPDDGNVFDQTNGAGVAFILTDAAVGSLNIQNNVIESIADDADASTPFQGDGISVSLIGSNSAASSVARLTRSDITGNVIGDFDNAVLGVAGSGIAVLTAEDSNIEDLLVADNMIGNAGNDNPAVVLTPPLTFAPNFIDDAGIRFDRTGNSSLLRVNPRPGDTSAVILDGNIVRNSGDTTVGNIVDGLQINAENGIVGDLEYEVRDSEFSGNSGEGIQLHTLGDASLVTDLRRNLIENNAFSGIHMEAFELSADDLETQGGVWTGNIIRNNAQSGVLIDSVSGDIRELIIGQLGSDPITGESFGNEITDNGFDGITINSGGGVTIDNNLIARNANIGIDINAISVGTRTALVRDNIITQNGLDGFEIISDSSTVTVAAFGNSIDENAARGVDVLVRNSGVANVRFGDGSFDNMNRISANALEGFYVVTTADGAQDQTSPSSTPLLSGGAATTAATPDLVLDINRNEISANNSENLLSTFEGGGLALRVGSSGSLTGPGFATMLADTTGDFLGDGSGQGIALGVGANNALVGNGRVNARIVNNTMEGNLGDDVLIQSFTSTVNPTGSAGAWTVGAFGVTAYQTDPLARLNLVFSGNVGNSLDVLETGAFYANAEGAFKSRLVTAAPPGPFTVATRERNAQRLPARGVGADQLAPNVSPDLGVGSGFQYPGVGLSTFRVESNFDTSGFLQEAEGFAIDFLPVPPISNAAGILTPGGTMPYGWTPVPPGTFQYDDPFLLVEPQPPTIPADGP